MAALGLARSLSKDDFVKELLIELQNQLFIVGAELATLEENYEIMSKSYKTISLDMVSGMEKYIDDLMNQENGIEMQLRGSLLTLKKTKIGRAHV